MRGIGTGTGAVLLALLALIVVWPWTVSSYFVGVGFDTLRWAALALSWLVLSGMTGYFSFGHVVFFGLGAYMVALTWLVPALVGRRHARGGGGGAARAPRRLPLPQGARALFS